MLVKQQIDATRANEPPRDYAVGRCISAWNDLSTCRPIGMATGPIPWTAIVAWCEFHQLDRDVAAAVIYVVRSIDLQRAQAEAAQRAKDTATGSKRGRS
jgi:hypothetical protein